VKYSFPPLAGGIEGGRQGDKIDIIPSTWSFFITRLCKKIEINSDRFLETKLLARLIGPIQQTIFRKGGIR
jgi:hypothetical protein